MRRLILVLIAAGALTAPAALAGGTFPEKIALPNAFAPEGIEIHGTTFFVGSTQTGAIYAGNLRTGAGKIRIPGATSAGMRGATGIEYDRGRLGSQARATAPRASTTRNQAPSRPSTSSPRRPPRSSTTSP